MLGRWDAGASGRGNLEEKQGGHWGRVAAGGWRCKGGVSLHLSERSHFVELASGNVGFAVSGTPKSNESSFNESEDGASRQAIGGDRIVDGN